MAGEPSILLVGGSGVVGRNVLEAAASRGVAVAAPPRTELDLLDPPSVARYLARVKPAFVIHAAGRVGGIQANIGEPVPFLVDNWDMGRNLIMASRAAGVKNLINLGSSCMYPRNSSRALKEDEVLTGPLEPTNEGYAIAKCAVARLCDYVRREDPELRYKTLIPCNVYGRHDKFDPRDSHLVAGLIHKLHQAKARSAPSVAIWGDGSARREFLYAGDLADAILESVLRFDSLPDVMNVGVGSDLAVKDYYRIVADVVGYTGAFVHDLDKPVGMLRKLTDVSRAQAWGWRARTPLEEGLRSAYAYYLESGAARALSAR